jgi:hypothetical protein
MTQGNKTQNTITVASNTGNQKYMQQVIQSQTLYTKHQHLAQSTPRKLDEGRSDKK